ncbi:IS1634 family transposase [Variovorax paradoxus]|uniref:IS1634 family transposase n=1 Tax=Variovorax paradoxus TaxID=34073 RepID=UPI001EED2B28|nr:IS1634 family transposase [Variovorax paradoxus]UKI04944.1 IS1634 family transposase [Variovorax paradoxus]UKI07173.1 IS1634 family transposase [Variovorax paradoxus]UKI09100.1 IS1634 family transposase [Variovorax paradoxus]UKI10449.1 IS1634 family transposase [Variovorax paradoxus]UKI10654.1 IS1634 family transposase [Variovorax paradoxus]
MFIKLTRSGGHTYAQLVESFRDEHGKPRQRTLATIGRVDETDGQVDSLLGGLLRAKGRSLSETSVPQVRFESALALGDVWALDQLWHELGFDGLAAVFRRARFTNPIEHALRVMVFNRLCDPDSKLGVLRWLQTVSMPGIDAEALTHQQLLRSMDALMDHQDAVDECVAGLLRPLIDEDLSVVFYDLTTIRAQGLSQQEGDVRRYGMSKEGMVVRQFMLGVVQTADGMPIYHEVFAGNTAEAPTLEPTLKKVMARYPHIRRLVVVADRGLLSLDNIEALSELRLSGGASGSTDQALEFILAVPGRRYGEFADILEPINARARARASEQETTEETIDEAQWQGLRLVAAHNPQQAAEQTASRQARIDQLRQRADQLVGKLDSQDAGKAHRGRKLSDAGVTARFFHEVSEAHLKRIIKVDLHADLFTYDIDQAALARAQAMDGKLLLVTNVADLTPKEVVQRYKALADIERGFRVLKSEIEIAPVFHRLPERIKAHASICMLALILYRVMRQRLKMSGSDLSPEAALADLRRIQRHRVSINNAAPIAGVSSIVQRQTDVLAALKIKKPQQDTQLSLL